MLACLPAAISTVYKQHALEQHGRPVDAHQLSLGVTAFEVVFIALAAPAAYQLQVCEFFSLRAICVSSASCRGRLGNERVVYLYISKHVLCRKAPFFPLCPDSSDRPVMVPTAVCWELRLYHTCAPSL